MGINVTRRHIVLELEGFATEEACWNYLLKLRWAKGFFVPDAAATEGERQAFQK